MNVSQQNYENGYYYIIKKKFETSVVLFSWSLISLLAKILKNFQRLHENSGSCP